MEGERVTLVCALSSGDLPVYLEWTKRPNFETNHQVPDFSVVETDPFTRILSIAKASQAHSGLYICEAKSSSHRISSQHNLTVLGKRNNN